MHLLAAITGICCLTLVLVDAFNTLVQPRRTQHFFRIARVYYWLTWSPFAAVARRIAPSLDREAFLGVYGPLSLLMLFGLWAVALTIAFGLLQWAVGMQPTAMPGTLENDLYLSASALFTLSSGDPKNSFSKWIAVVESGLGLAFLGLVVGYLPLLYASFSRREISISLLDARAGSPPSAGALFQSAPANSQKFEQELALWEEWSAQVLETHLSFPMLAYFRSHHSNQAWLTALVAMVDCAAVVSLCAKDDLQRQGKLTFAMGRHALADIANEFGLEKESIAGEGEIDRLSDAHFVALQQSLRASPKLYDADLCTQAKLRLRRRLYESQAAALSGYFMMSLPSWIADESSRGNWKVAMEDREEVPFTVSDPFTEEAKD